MAGAHAAVQCASCHPGAAVGTYTGLSTECVTCHQNDYANARSLDHAAAGLSLQCETCHSIDQWQNARFDHDTLTSFALTSRGTTICIHHRFLHMPFRTARPISGAFESVG